MPRERRMTLFPIAISPARAVTAIGASVTIADFSTSDGDKLDIADVLDGHYDQVHDAIANFVSLTTSGSDTLLNVDLDGTGGTYSSTQIATIQGVTGLTVGDLITNGELIVPTCACARRNALCLSAAKRSGHRPTLCRRNV